MLTIKTNIHSWRAWEDLARKDCHVLSTALYLMADLEYNYSISLFCIHYLACPYTCKSRKQYRKDIAKATNLRKTSYIKPFGQEQFSYLGGRHVSFGNSDLQWLAQTTSLFVRASSCYMIRSMEEEFQRIVGVSVPLWAFVVAVMLFNVKGMAMRVKNNAMNCFVLHLPLGSNLYFWISVVPITLVLLVGAKLQHVIATLTSETAGLTGHSVEGKMRPRDDLFWFKKPELFLKLIHFILFQWQFGYRSCFIRNHLQVYIRLVLGFSGQFLCSYSTLPLYALVTQMGTNYKAALFPPRIRETIHGWWKAATSGKRRHSIFTDDSTMHRDTSTLMSEEDNHHLLDIPENDADPVTQIELQPASFISVRPTTVANETSSGVANPFLRHSASVSSSETSNFHVEDLPRSSSMPVRR
ncbi:hypothetical protein POTOM_039895 [Populus tomentosa]|uniref:MLO-like protein n=1 Tax=Populus tomentosa TaxID=118781 RepID=A0A8X7YTG4_POPTO|nr:hypothetical protein POTOM_039895 [Populus tomentosa]